MRQQDLRPVSRGRPALDGPEVPGLDSLIMMAANRRRVTAMTPAEFASAGMLAASVGGLAAGGVLYLAGAHGAAHGAWLAMTVLGLGYALLTLIGSLRRHRAGVDI